MSKHQNIFLSISHALRGILITLKSERNFRVQVFCGVLVVLLGLYFRIQRGEWLVLILVSALVLALELVNSIVERIVDLVKPRMHPVIHDIKDMMAAAVLVAALAAIAVGIVVFWPYLSQSFMLYFRS